MNLMERKGLPISLAESKILIIGAKTGNFTNGWKQDSRIMFWDSTDPKTNRRHNVPQDVDMVIFTRFVNHAITDRVRKNMPEGCVVMGPCDTGLIKQFLASRGIDHTNPQEEIMQDSKTDILANTAQDVSVSETGPVLRRFKKGELTNLILELGDFDSPNPPSFKGILPKLQQRAVELGVSVTENALGLAFYRVRKILKEDHSAENKTAAPQKVEEQTSQPVQKEVGKGNFSSDIRQALSEVMDVFVALTKENENLKNELTVAQARIAELEAMKKEFDEIQEVLKKFRK